MLSIAGFGVEFKPGEIVPEVVAVGVDRNRDGQENLGLEPTAELLGEARHLRRVARWLVAPIKFFVTSLESLRVRFLLAQKSRLVLLTVFQRKVNQPVERLEIRGVSGDEPFQCPPFRIDVAALEGKPGGQLLNLGRT